MLYCPARAKPSRRYDRGRSVSGDRRAAIAYIGGMTSPSLDMAEIGALIGDPARANMLAALMDGRSLTAKELAYMAGVAPQTASGHLARLAAANLLALTARGRFRYYRLASPLVGQMLESVIAVAAVQLPPRRLPSRIDTAMRDARTCYDHVAGRLGVGIADRLVAQGHVVLGEDGGAVTESGSAFLAEFGAEPAARKGSTRPFCRPCLDWSERRLHIAGAVGAALCRRFLELGWVEKKRDSRALGITAPGRRGFAQSFDVQL
jgi:DNA-binding transcriptional ArsR family regulator